MHDALLKEIIEMDVHYKDGEEVDHSKTAMPKVDFNI